MVIDYKKKYMKYKNKYIQARVNGGKLVNPTAAHEALQHHIQVKDDVGLKHEFPKSLTLPSEIVKSEKTYHHSSLFSPSDVFLISM